MKTPFTRRTFLRQSTLLTSGLILTGTRPFRTANAAQANDRLNIGVIGVAGRGGANLQGVMQENIVALCDVDAHNLAGAAQRFPQAKTYRDYRRMLDLKEVEAVVISTPDHTHAVAAAAALRSGHHVYCEKPLTRTVSEARVITELARQQNRVTQIGTQIHAGDNYRRVVELIRSDAIGSISEIHVWVAATYGGMDRPKDTPPIPEHLDYDLWLGPVEPRAYSPQYLPGQWRHWWAFGGGALADFGCHYMDLPYWALGLKHPAGVEPLDGPPVHPESTPPWLIVHYRFPGKDPASVLPLTWYHGGKKPPLLTPERARQWNSGVLFVGERGQLLADYTRHVLLPEDDFASYQRPEASIPKSIGHHREWIEACKGRGTTTCPFDYSGPLTETALLGNVAYRVGKNLEWDWKQLKAVNCQEAAPFIQHHYRDGWVL